MLGEIPVPTVLMVGSAERTTPPGHAQRLAAGVPGARLVTVPDAGHMLNWETEGPYDNALIGNRVPNVRDACRDELISSQFIGIRGIANLIVLQRYNDHAVVNRETAVIDSVVFGPLKRRTCLLADRINPTQAQSNVCAILRGNYLQSWRGGHQAT